LAPRVLIYVSCAPRTLARDAWDLARLGFAPQNFRPFDMLALSDAVEVLAEFAPVDVPPPHVVYEDERLVAVEKAPHEVTIRQGGHTRSLLERVRLLPGAAQAMPIH